MQTYRNKKIKIQKIKNKKIKKYKNSKNPWVPAISTIYRDSTKNQIKNRGRLLLRFTNFFKKSLYGLPKKIVN